MVRVGVSKTPAEGSCDREEAKSKTIQPSRNPSKTQTSILPIERTLMARLKVKQTVIMDTSDRNTLQLNSMTRTSIQLQTTQPKRQHHHHPPANRNACKTQQNAIAQLHRVVIHSYGLRLFGRSKIPLHRTSLSFCPLTRYFKASHPRRTQETIKTNETHHLRVIT